MNLWYTRWAAAGESCSPANLRRGRLLVNKLKATILVTGVLILVGGLWAQNKAPLALKQTIPIPGITKEGDFDHMAVDVQGNRLFLMGEDNSVIEIFDLGAGKLIHTISDVKAPHSMVYRGDIKKFFVVDGGAAEVKIYDSDSYKPAGTIKLRDDADSMVYDPSTKYMYVVNGGEGAKMAYSFVSVVDTTAGKSLGDIKIDSDAVEALALEKSGTRLFVNMTGKDAVAVVDREKRTVTTTWPTGQVAKHLIAMSFDEADHRLFVTTRTPGKLIVIDTDSGKVVTSLPCVGDNDDMAYDSASKRIFISASGFVDIYQQKDADHYDQIAHVPTAFKARTSILVPEWKKYYLAIPHRGTTAPAVRVYDVLPN
jgi:DNA-binding beta-propeller fold protein YncE